MEANTIIMNIEKKSNNDIYFNAMRGVVLFIISAALTIAGWGEATITGTASLIAAAVTGIGATALLYKAIKKDKERLSWSR